MLQVKGWLNEIFGEPKTAIKNFLTMFAGCFLIGVSIFTFYEQAHLQVGGFSGLALILQRILGTNVSVGMISIILNVPVLFAIFFFINHHLLVRTIVGMIVLGYTLDLARYLSAYILPILFKGSVQEADYILLALFGGALFGVGSGLIVRSGYATGGSDNLAFLIKLVFKNLKFAFIVWLFDFTVILAGAYFNGNASSTTRIILYSIVALLTDVKVLDLVLSGYSYKRVVFIISRQHQKIADEILQHMYRGVTGLKSIGHYSKQEGEVLFVVLDIKQVPRLKTLVAKIDHNAFVFVLDSREVYGEGFARSYF